MNVSWGSDIPQIRTPRNQIVEVRRSGKILPEPFGLEHDPHAYSLLSSVSEGSSAERKIGEGRAVAIWGSAGTVGGGAIAKFENPSIYGTSLLSHDEIGVSASILATPDPATITRPARAMAENVEAGSKEGGAEGGTTERELHFDFLQKARSELKHLLHERNSTDINVSDGETGSTGHNGASQIEFEMDERGRNFPAANKKHKQLKIRSLLEAAQASERSNCVPKSRSSIIKGLDHGEKDNELAHQESLQSRSKEEDRRALESLYSWVKRADESWAYSTDKMIAQVHTDDGHYDSLISSYRAKCCRSYMQMFHRRI